jgi:hypothetical protein
MGKAASLANIGSIADSSLGFRNRIINGSMVIDQRNAGASLTANNSIYAVDRFRTYMSQSSKGTIQQNAGSVTPPTGFSNYLGFTSTSAYSVLATDFFVITQYIEGFNTSDFGFGTAGASSVTLSFWVRSSLTGTFGGSLENSAFNRSYPFTYTISSANTWEQKSVTIAGDTSGTWVGATNGVGIRVGFSLGAGSTQSGTAGVWASADYQSATGATSVVGTSGATFYITGVQLEKGSIATSFDYRPYTTELQLAQRYFQTSYSGSAVGTATSTNSLYLAAPAAGNYQGIQIGLPVSMRTAPTVVSYSTTGVSGKFRVAGADVTTTTTNTAINYIFIYANNSAITISQDINTHYTASSEL